MDNSTNLVVDRAKNLLLRFIVNFVARFLHCRWFHDDVDSLLIVFVCSLDCINARAVRHQCESSSLNLCIYLNLVF